MSNKNDINISKLISLALRHKPEALNLKLDEGGWCYVYSLIQGINSKGYTVDLEDIKRIVKEDNKQRYSFNDENTKIRANQGHSINIDLGLTKLIPPEILYHGTSKNVLDSIYKSGIKKQARQYVHLSKDIETAKKVGQRHGEAIILEIDSNKMNEDGISFYLSKNGVWLTDYVDSKYILNKF